MAVMRWDPFREMVSLRQAMDQLFDESVVRAPAVTGSVVAPAIDVVESAAEVSVKVALPGVKADEVEITVLDGTLQIVAEAKAEEQREGERWLLRERRRGRFERRLTLPVPIKAEAVAATLDGGILTITLPKADIARPRRIAVAAASSDQPAAVDEAAVAASH